MTFLFLPFLSTDTQLCCTFLMWANLKSECVMRVPRMNSLTHPALSKVPRSSPTTSSSISLRNLRLSSPCRRRSQSQRWFCADWKPTVTAGSPGLSPPPLLTRLVKPVSPLCPHQRPRSLADSSPGSDAGPANAEAGGGEGLSPPMISN